MGAEQKSEQLPIATKDRVEKQVNNIFKEANTDLAALQLNSIKNQITKEHAINTLKLAQTKFETMGYKKATDNLGAGLVLSVQIALKELGYKPGILDGIYMNPQDRKNGTFSNSKTWSAVEKFQKDNDLTQDGWAGLGTVSKLLEKLGAAPVTDTNNKNTKDKPKDKIQKDTNNTKDDTQKNTENPKDNTQEKIDESETPIEDILTLTTNTIDIEGLDVFLREQLGKLPIDQQKKLLATLQKEELNQADQIFISQVIDGFDVAKGTELLQKNTEQVKEIIAQISNEEKAFILPLLKRFGWTEETVLPQDNKDQPVKNDTNNVVNNDKNNIKPKDKTEQNETFDISKELQELTIGISDLSQAINEQMKIFETKPETFKMELINLYTTLDEIETNLKTNPNTELQKQVDIQKGELGKICKDIENPDFMTDSFWKYNSMYNSPPVVKERQERQKNQKKD